MAYQIIIECKEDFDWLSNTIKKLHQASEARPEHYLEFVEIYRRLDEAIKNKTKINNEWVESSFKTGTIEKRVIDEKKPRAKKTRVIKVLPKPDDYCPSHPSYQGKRAHTRDCESCWNVYDKFMNAGKPSPQRLAFYRKINTGSSDAK